MIFFPARGVEINIFVVVATAQISITLIVSTRILVTFTIVLVSPQIST